MIEYKTYDGKTLKIPENEYNKGVLTMLKFIGQKEGWEESQDKYFKLFYKGLYESKRKNM